MLTKSTKQVLSTAALMEVDVLAEEDGPQLSMKADAVSLPLTQGARKGNSDLTRR